MATYNGTSGNDVDYGTGYDDTQLGYGGNDYLLSGYGDDSINGGAGNDMLIGMDGDDTIIGGVGEDVIESGRGRDVVSMGQATSGDQQTDILRPGGDFEDEFLQLLVRGFESGTYDFFDDANLNMAAFCGTGDWSNSGSAGADYWEYSDGAGNWIRFQGLTGPLDASDIL